MQSKITWNVLLAALLSQAIHSNQAIGGIISSSGAIQIVDEAFVPNNITEGNWESDSFVQVFSERQNFILPTSIAVDITSPGSYGRSAGFIPSTQSIGMNSGVFSYFLHFDPIGTPGNMTRTGSITFDSDVVGIIVGVENGINVASPNNTLGLSNAQLGVPRISYDVAITDLYLGGGDQITLSSDRRSLSVLLISGRGSDNMRIITYAVPEPAATSALILVVAPLLLMMQRKSRKLHSSSQFA